MLLIRGDTHKSQIQHGKGPNEAVRHVEHILLVRRDDLATYTTY